jgi:hypothetical protein
LIRLPSTLRARGTPELESVLRWELEQLDPRDLPLQQGLSTGSHVGEEPFRVVVIRISDEGDLVRVKAGVFYTGIIAGCSCADDPTPVEGQPEYCEIEITIDTASAEASVVLVSD